MMFKFVRTIEEKFLFPFSMLLFSASGIIMFAESLQRSILSKSFDWAGEMSTYCMVWAVMIMLANAGKHGHHIRIEILTSKLSPSFKQYLNIFVNFLSLTFCVVFVYSSFLVIEHAFQTKQLSQSTLQMPVWIVNLILLISGVLLAIYYIELIVNGIRNKIAGDIPPQNMNH